MIVIGQLIRIEERVRKEFTNYLYCIRDVEGKVFGFQVSSSQFNVIQNINIGDAVSVEFDIDGKDYEREGKIYNYTWLKAVFIKKVVKDEEKPVKEEDPFEKYGDKPMPTSESLKYQKEEDDDLPF